MILTACGSGTPGDGSSSDGVNSDDHRVFVTSTSYDGNLGGISGADTKCATAATAAGLERTYKAIITTADADTTAFKRLNFSGAIYTVDASDNSALVAASGADLWLAETKALLNDINLDENGATVSKTPWTGTSSDGGVISTSHCSSWTVNSAGTDGEIGDTGRSDDRWVELGLENCSNQNPIYCISQ